MDNYVYEGRFERNILIVGKTFCRNTYFVQKLATNNFFGVLEKAE